MVTNERKGGKNNTQQKEESYDENNLFLVGIILDINNFPFVFEIEMIESEQTTITCYGKQQKWL